MLICKPAGIPSQPDLTGQPDVLSILQTEHPTAKPIHRLDTPTGGVMVFGLTQAATTQLSTMIQDHSVFCKEYLAVTATPPTPSEGEMRDILYHDKRQNKAFAVDAKRKGAKEAVLTYRTPALANDGHALVRVRLHTGRTHQIRAQFASRGMPLVGDGKYGSREKCPSLGLWAYQLSFPHPIGGHPLTIQALPDTGDIPWSYFQDQLLKN